MVADEMAETPKDAHQSALHPWAAEPAALEGAPAELEERRHAVQHEGDDNSATNPHCSMQRRAGEARTVAAIAATAAIGSSSSRRGVREGRVRHLAFGSTGECTAQ